MIASFYFAHPKPGWGRHSEGPPIAPYTIAGLRYGYRPLFRQPLFRQNASEKAELTLTRTLTLAQTLTITLTLRLTLTLTLTHCITHLEMSE